MSDDGRFRFSDESRELLEEHGGDLDEARYLGTPEQVAYLISVTERLADQLRQRSADALSGNDRAQIERVGLLASRLIDEIGELSPEAREWLDSGTDRLPEALTSAGPGESDVTDGVVAEVSRLSAAADLVAAFTQRGSGRPRKVLEADMVYLLALNYQEIFGRLPPRSERSAFAEFVRAALEEAGQPAQVKNLIRQALDRAES